MTRSDERTTYCYDPFKALDDKWLKTNVTLSDERSIVTPNPELSLDSTEEVWHNDAYELLETHSIAVEEKSGWEIGIIQI